MDKDKILAALPALDRASLGAIQAVIASLLNGPTAAHDKGATELTLAVFNALQATVGQPTAYKTFAQTTAAKHLQKRLPDMGTFLNANFSGWDKNKVGQQAFLQMLFGLLADDLKSRGVKPTLGIMVNNLGRLAEAFNDAFPGYLTGKMGALILKRFQ